MPPTKEQLKGAKRYVFPDNNKAQYFMDFAFWETLPSDRIFYLKGDAPHGHVELVAHGYGIEGEYGNGSIIIDPKYLPPELKL
jgi:hypothetical protein